MPVASIAESISSNLETMGDKVKCTCNYRCGRGKIGYRMIHEKTTKQHLKFDADGRRCNSKLVVDRGIYHVGNSSEPDPRPDLSGAILDTIPPCNGQILVSRQTLWRDKKRIHPGDLYSALIGANGGAHGLEDLISEGLPDYMDVNCNGVPPPMQYGIHILPQTNLGKDEAIYRQTWRLQAELDKAKVPQTVQDSILKILFGRMKCQPGQNEQDAPEFGAMGLGELLTHAGPTWNGGRHGLEALSSFDGLCSTFKDYGMPKTQRWRMCLGSKKKWHAPRVLGPSTQDDYNVSTGDKCHCSNLTPEEKKKNKWRLARMCKKCGEVCLHEGCGKARKDMLAFEYFAIGPMLRKLCSSRSVCHEFQAMWRDKDKWFRTDSSLPKVYKEWWDGSRASELSYFWDSANEFQLPVLCQECYATIPNKCPELLDKLNWDENNQQYDFQCIDCGARIQASPKFTKGDPRNIALMAHWDGFQSTTTSHKSTWTVEVQVLNVSSFARLPPIPLLFIPPCDDKQMFHKKFNCLDAFLEPLIRELQELFVDGIEVVYNYPVELIDDFGGSSEGRSSCLLRAILVLFTGDHPAQCKFGGWNTTGHQACRYCKMTSRWEFNNFEVLGSEEESAQQFSGRALYDNNRRQMRYPPPVRNIQEAKEAAIRCVKAGTEAERKRISRESGISNMTRAWRLHDLTGFCLIKDLVYDTMHILALCLFKKYCDCLVNSIAQQEGTKSEVSANKQKKQKQQTFEEALAEVSAKKPKGFDGRWPTKPFERLGYFKAEEYTRFILYCLPHILYELGTKLDEELGMLGILLVEIARLFYIRSREEGWSEEAMKKGRSLLASWRVRSEEAWGPNGAILEHVAGSGEIFLGIERHGPHHIYWCYHFERMVSYYGRTRTNQKNQETTYSQHFARRFFTTISSYIWEDDDGLFPHQRDLVKVHNSLRVPSEHKKEHKARDARVFECPEWHEHCVAIVSSQKMALDLWNGMFFSIESYGCKHMVIGKGVGIGSTRKKVLKLDSSTKASITKCWMEAGVLVDFNMADEMSQDYTPLRAAVWRKQVYRPGDHVVVLVDGSTDATHPRNWKAVILRIFMHQFMGKMEIFFEASWYKQKCAGLESDLKWERDTYSQFTLLETKLVHFPGDSCRRLSRILHKFFPIQREVGRKGAKEVVALEIGDTLVREVPANLECCPPFPEVNDVIMTIADAEMSPKLCVIRGVISPFEIDMEDKLGRVQVSWLTTTGVRSEAPIYRANRKIEAEIQIQALVELRTQFQAIQFHEGTPVRWAVVQ